VLLNRFVSALVQWFSVQRVFAHCNNKLVVSPQSGYPGCRQNGETVVMRGLLWVLETDCPRGSCQVHLTTTIHWKPS